MELFLKNYVKMSNFYRLLTPVFLILFASTLLRGEGTKQLMPDPSDASCVAYVQGNDGTGKEGSIQTAADSDRLKFYIDDPSNEIVYFGFRKQLGSGTLTYAILDPNQDSIAFGVIHSTDPGSGGWIDNDGVEAYNGPQQLGNANGYNAASFVPNYAGEYTILFDHSNGSKFFVHPFDVTVAKDEGSGYTAVDGRLYTKRWHLNCTSSSNKACMEFYAYTGDSIVVSLDLNGMQPWGFTVAFNSFGCYNTGDIEEDRKSIDGQSQDAAEYLVFLSDPDPAIWENPEPFSLSLDDFYGCKSADVYCIGLTTNQITEFNVYIDLDSTGAYEANGKDVYFPFKNVNTGYVCIPWDGRDNFGEFVSAGDTGTVIVEATAGLLHFPIYDAENSTGGFNASIVRPTGTLPAIELFWDNTGISLGTSPEKETDGCSSNCNAWSGNAGDVRTVNTWMYAVAATQSDNFTIQSICDSDRDGIDDSIDEDDDNDGIPDTDEGLSCSNVTIDKYAQSLTTSNNVSNPTYIIGAPDDNGVFFNAVNDDLDAAMVVTIPDGNSFDIEWYSVSGASTTVEILGSTDGASFTSIANISTTSINYTTSSVTNNLGIDINYIRINYVSGGSIYIDAIIYGETISQCVSEDKDNDGIMNHMDLDADGDGIPDVIENGGTDTDGNGRADGIADLDGDGIPDRVDASVQSCTDSGGDGICDSAQGGTDTDADGIQDTDDPDADGDGWIDLYDNSGSSTGTKLTLINTDGDGQSDFLDLDADNDGIPDIVEAGGVDSDGDGKVDDASDEDGDGFSSEYDPHDDGQRAGSGVTGTPYILTGADQGGANEGLPVSLCTSCDFDGDNLPNHLELDSDNDGITDVIESGGADGNQDGIADDGSGGGTRDDTNNDGWVDNYTGKVKTESDGSDSNSLPDYANLNSTRDVDADGYPNWMDIDADNDGIVDNTEAQSTGSYTQVGTDGDNDGLDDVYEGSGQVGTFVASGIDPVDTDNDGTPDYLDTDSDDDGEFDSIEGHDTDNNGVVNGSDSPNANTGAATGNDTDGDGLDDGYDNDIGTFNPDNNDGSSSSNLEPDSHPKNNVSASDRDWRSTDINIAGYTWVDNNQDGVKSPWESNLENVTVELLDNSDVVLGSTTTNADGYYFFNVSSAGTYKIRFTAPTSYPDITAQDQGSDDQADSDPDNTGLVSNITVSVGSSAIYVFGGFYAAPLPVELAYFRATAKDCSVQLTWKTFVEINNSHFVLQRSADGVRYTDLAEIDGIGTTVEPQQYGFIDHNPGEINYYRLVQYDFDGAYEVHRQVVVENPCVSQISWRVFPNPTVDRIQLQVDQLNTGIRASLFHAQGQLVGEWWIENSETTLSLDHLSAGLYYLRIGDQIQKIVKKD